MAEQGLASWPSTCKVSEAMRQQQRTSRYIEDVVSPYATKLGTTKLGLNLLRVHDR